MGRDKASVVLSGRTLLVRTLDALNHVPGLVEIVIVAASDQQLPAISSTVPVAVVRDEVEGLGPLPAIARGLRKVRSAVALVVASDMPFLQPALLALLAEAARDAPAVVPLVDERPQPLCGAVRRDALPALLDLLATDVRRASALAEIAGARLLSPSEWQVADPRGVSFVGVNTREDLVRAASLVEELG
jgi:molybdopterin-guanine dinucleotide biosynthesis protein A